MGLNIQFGISDLHQRVALFHDILNKLVSIKKKLM